MIEWVNHDKSKKERIKKREEEVLGIYLHVKRIHVKNS